jgi:FkbM family methyltransferase
MKAIRAAKPSHLYVAGDGPRQRPGDAERCDQARQIATTVDWPCQLHTLFRERNLGCRRAVSSAIDWFFDHEEEGIILEDDCLPSADFFRFCGELLPQFRSEKRVMAVCGSCYTRSTSAVTDSYYFSYYADVWGWATWKRAWRLYDRDLSTWPEFKRTGGLKSAFKGAAWRERFWSNIFDRTARGEFDTWDHAWAYAVIEQGGIACYPTRNLVSNLGYGADATHTKGENLQEQARLAGRSHQPLRFPLRHPNQLLRSEALERELEQIRLNLNAPERRGRRLIRLGLRRVFRLLPSSVRSHIKRVAGLEVQDPDQYLQFCSNIVHVGANSGQERALYHSHDLMVFWIEPIPDLYEQLVRNIQPYPKQIAIRALLTDKAGDTMQLNIANNSGLSSSIFDLRLHKDIWPEVDFVDHVSVVSETLDGLVERGLIPPVIDAIILDTQGSELLVLKGAQAVLHQVSFVKVEAADFESYKGCATVGMIKEFLEGLSFDLVKKEEQIRHPSGGGYYELYFKKSFKSVQSDFRAAKAHFCDANGRHEGEPHGGGFKSLMARLLWDRS